MIDKDYRSTIIQLCFSHADSHGLSLLLHDVTTLYFEVQQEDEYRKSGLSKERLEPQIVLILQYMAAFACSQSSVKVTCISLGDVL